jgi:hypothetical protein
MSENGLVALASTLRQLLASPESLVPTTKAEHDARLDIIDMFPDLNRTLLGDKQTLRDLAWSVSSLLVTSAMFKRGRGRKRLRYVATSADGVLRDTAPSCPQPARHLPLQDCQPCPRRLLDYL